MSSVIFAGPAPRLWLRVEQDADKGFYAQIPPDTADGFIVNANLVEHSPAAVGAFLDKLERPFVIDPMSYRFDRTAWHTRSRDGEVSNKRNYARLWQKYAAGVDGLTGDPLADRGIRGIATEQGLLKFCANVIDFQDRRLRAEWVEDGAAYAGMERLFGFQLAPSAYVAPYLVIGEGVQPRTSRHRRTLQRRRCHWGDLPSWPFCLFSRRCSEASMRSGASQLESHGLASMER